MNTETRSPHRLALALVLLLAGPVGAANADEDEIPFDEAEIFLELNHTDGDLGIHAAIDGGPWRHLEIENPYDHRLLEIRVRGRLRRQGLTQLAFESAEPTFDELDPERFFQRFREGTYEIEGVGLDGTELESEAELSHVLAAPVGNVEVAGEPAAESCDDALPVVSAPIVIRWDPVTTHHPDLGKPGPVEIVLYQFFVETDDAKFSVDLPPDVTEFQVPAEMLALGAEEYKFEIIAREASGNNTAIESCFEVE